MKNNIIMKKSYFLITILFSFLALLSCNEKKFTEVVEVPVHQPRNRSINGGKGPGVEEMGARVEAVGKLVAQSAALWCVARDVGWKAIDLALRDSSSKREDLYTRHSLLLSERKRIFLLASG